MLSFKGGVRTFRRTHRKRLLYHWASLPEKEISVMSRQAKVRKIQKFPKVRQFLPVVEDQKTLGPVFLKLEEWEAIRLKDQENLRQEDCAQRMEVSRQTFQNILESARRTVSTALVDGLPLLIEGGDYTTENCRFFCPNCHTEYDVRCTKDRKICPRCGEKQVVCIKERKECEQWCKNGVPQSMTLPKRVEKP